MSEKAESVVVRVRSEQDQGLRIRRFCRARASSILSLVWPAGNPSDFLGEEDGFAGGVHALGVN